MSRRYQHNIIDAADGTIVGQASGADAYDALRSLNLDVYNGAGHLRVDAHGRAELTYEGTRLNADPIGRDDVDALALDNAGALREAPRVGLITIDRRNTAARGPHVQIRLDDDLYAALAAAVEVAYDDPESTPPEYQAAAAELWKAFHA